MATSIVDFEHTLAQLKAENAQLRNAEAWKLLKQNQHQATTIEQFMPEITSLKQERFDSQQERLQQDKNQATITKEFMVEIESLKEQLSNNQQVASNADDQSDESIYLDASAQTDPAAPIVSSDDADTSKDTYDMQAMVQNLQEENTQLMTDYQNAIEVRSHANDAYALLQKDRRDLGQQLRAAKIARGLNFLRRKQADKSLEKLQSQYTSLHNERVELLSQVQAHVRAKQELVMIQRQVAKTVLQHGSRGGLPARFLEDVRCLLKDPIGELEGALKSDQPEVPNPRKRVRLGIPARNDIQQSAKTQTHPEQSQTRDVFSQNEKATDYPIGTDGEPNGAEGNLLRSSMPSLLAALGQHTQARHIDTDIYKTAAESSLRNNMFFKYGRLTEAHWDDKINKWREAKAAKQIVAE